MTKGRWLAVGTLGVVLVGGCGAEGQPTTPQAASETPQASSDTAEPTLEPTDEPDEDLDTKPSEPTEEETEPEPEPKSERPSKLYAVLDVTDGDTVKVAYQGEESVRVIGIDTPETVHPSVPVECWGPRASDEAEQLLAGRSVRLVFDPSQGRRDTYDRLLAYVEIPGRGDFGEIMVRGGHAAEYTYDTTYARQAKYQAAEAGAQSVDKGLWGQCGGTDVPLQQPEPSPEPPAPQNGGGGGCAPGYDPCVPPYPPDVNCDDVDGPIRVSGDDPHELDADGDGTACES